MPRKNTTPKFTRKQFITAYQGQLQLVYEWARQSPDQLKTFISDVETTIKASPSSHLSGMWLCTGEVVQATWEQLGGTGKVTLNKLRELPVGKDETV